MEKKELLIDYQIYKNEIPSQYLELYKKAESMLASAYCKYSNFSVGAAVLLENKEIITGSNQENAAYPSGLCAERTAIFSANALYPNIRVEALAIIAADHNIRTKKYVSPCGACRQVISEVIRRTGDFDVFMIGGEESIVIKASKLLPFSFDFL